MGQKDACKTVSYKSSHYNVCGEKIIATLVQLFSRGKKGFLNTIPEFQFCETLSKLKHLDLKVNIWNGH